MYKQQPTNLDIWSEKQITVLLVLHPSMGYYHPLDIVLLKIQFILIKQKTMIISLSCLRYLPELGELWLDSVVFGQIRSYSVRFGRVRSDSVGFGGIWSDLVGFGRSSSWEGT